MNGSCLSRDDIIAMSHPRMHSILFLGCANGPSCVPSMNAVNPYLTSSWRLARWIIDLWPGLALAGLSRFLGMSHPLPGTWVRFILIGTVLGGSKFYVNAHVFQMLSRAKTSTGQFLHASLAIMASRIVTGAMQTRTAIRNSIRTYGLS